MDDDDNYLASEITTQILLANQPTPNYGEDQDPDEGHIIGNTSKSSNLGLVFIK
ncbi:hypothetical protein H4Q26_014780 [Puccinia striiformis f. sp. tritici PST-130]|nr:hypothetical protein H4Q26_014780 [Puccinia striiformis f. sp. tritici PST-130]